MKTGTYLGNGIDPHVVTGIGFKPRYLTAYNHNVGNSKYFDSAAADAGNANIDANEYTYIVFP